MVLKKKIKRKTANITDILTDTIASDILRPNNNIQMIPT